MENYVLKFPIKIIKEGVEIPLTNISLRRPTVGDQIFYKKLNGTPHANHCKRIARLSGLEVDSIKELAAKDYRCINDMIDEMSESKAEVKVEDEKKFSIDLKYPIKDMGTEIKAVTLRRARVSDLIALEHMGGIHEEVARNAIVNLAEITPKAVDSMDLEDFAAINMVLIDFL